MKTFCIWIVTVSILCCCLFIGAVSHEGDLTRNFNETGNAKAWFHDIKK